MAKNNAFLAGNLGVAAAPCRVAEYGDKYNHTTVLTLDGASAVLPAIAGGADLAVGLKLYDFPAGAVIVEASRLDVAIQQVDGNIDADTPDIGLGTTIASGVVAVLGGTAGFENVLTGQTAADCDGTATDKMLATQLLVEVADSHALYLNVADGWAASGDAAAVVSGQVIVHWRFVGA